MAVLESVVRRDDVFDRRRRRMEGLVAELRERTAQVARGGGEKATERHRSRGKLTARERIDRLVDPGGAFLELNALAAWELYDGQAPSAGIVTFHFAAGNSGPYAMFRYSQSITIGVCPEATVCGVPWTGMKFPAFFNRAK